MQDPSSAPVQDPAEATDDRRTRWSIYWLLIICSLAVVCARLWQVEGISYGESVPFLSANDRSRWCTIRSLGDHNTYAIDPVLQSDGGKSWDTIDKVMHWGRDYRPHFYSSKPTLLSTVLTYPYLALKEVTDWTLQHNTFEVVRWLLVICQILPLALFFWSIGRIGELVARTEWTRVFLIVVVGFGTFVTTVCRNTQQPPSSSDLCFGCHLCGGANSLAEIKMVGVGISWRGFRRPMP